MNIRTISRKAWEITWKNLPKLLIGTLFAVLPQVIMNMLTFRVVKSFFGVQLLSCLLTLCIFPLLLGIISEQLRLWRGGTIEIRNFFAYYAPQKLRVIGILVLILCIFSVLISIPGGLVSTTPEGAARLSPTVSLVLLFLMLFALWCVLRSFLVFFLFVEGYSSDAFVLIKASFHHMRGHVWPLICQTVILLLPTIFSVMAIAVLCLFLGKTGLVLMLPLTVIVVTLFLPYVMVGLSGFANALLKDVVGMPQNNIE